MNIMTATSGIILATPSAFAWEEFSILYNL
jgi:hypothetical protein